MWDFWEQDTIRTAIRILKTGECGMLFGFVAQGSKPSFLRRTLIDPKCALGGEETFIRTPSRVDQQEDTLHAWYDYFFFSAVLLVRSEEHARSFCFVL